MPRIRTASIKRLVVPLNGSGGCRPCVSRHGAASLRGCDPHRASCSAGGVSVIDPQDIADELIAAEREHKAIGQFSDNYPDFDLETAYRAQRAFVQSKLD